MFHELNAVTSDMTVADSDTLKVVTSYTFSYIRQCSLQQVLEEPVTERPVRSLCTTKVIDTTNQFIPKFKINNHNSPNWTDREVIGHSKCKETSRVTAHHENNPNAWSLTIDYEMRLRSLYTCIQQI